MTTILLSILTVVVFAVGHRLRGSILPQQWFGTGMTVSRLAFWAAPGALMCVLLGYTWWQVIGIFVGLYVGAIYGQPGHLNMGRELANYALTTNRAEHLADISAAALRGLHWTWYAAVPLMFSNPDAALVVMLSGFVGTPVAYEIGWRMPTLCSAMRRGAEWGEFLLGAVIGTAFAFAATL